MVEEQKESKLSKIEKILIANCLASGIALGAASMDNNFNIQDIVPYVTGLVSSIGLLTTQTYRLIGYNPLADSYRNRAPEVHD